MATWRRSAVLAILWAFVLASVIPFDLIPNGGSNDDDESSLGFGDESDEHSMLLDLEAFDMAKEPMEITHNDGLGYSDRLEVELAALPTKEMRPVEHHSRVLSAIDEGFRSEKDGVVKQLTSREIGYNVSEKPKEGEEKNDENNSEIRTENHTIASPSKLDRRPMILHDTVVRQLKEQLTMAKASLGLQSTLSDSNFTKEFRTRIRDVQRVLGDATKDSDLPENADEKLKALEEALSKSKQIEDDCPAVVRKLDANYQPVRNKLRDDMRFSRLLTQNVAKSLPKEVHCLALRLTAQYHALHSSQQQFPNGEKLEDPKLYHYVLISDNVLAAGVVVKSAVYFAKEPENHVFHILTDEIHYAAMSMWFLDNPPDEAAIEVRHMEEFSWINSSYSPVMKQLESESLINFYFKTLNVLPDGNLKFRNPKYLSMLNHLRFYIPEIFPKLNKVIFLDDDIVVQQDLTGLWSIDLEGMVNGAVETCRDNFHRFSQYLNFSNSLIAETDVDPQSCGWAFGMNIFDLVEWRKKKITDIYHHWQTLNDNRRLWQLGTLPVGLLAFWKQTMPISKTWHVLGLGYNPEISHDDIKQAAVIHFNGNLKPWLEIGIPHFRRYWTRFVDYNEVYLRDCKIISF